MDTPDDMDPDTRRLQARLDEVEIKLSFTEDLVDRLNEVVVRQQGQIDGLLRELRELRDRLGSGEAAAPRSLREELPPHY